MTPSDLAALKALVELAEKATPGPWETSRGHKLYRVKTGDGVFVLEAYFAPQNKGDSDFIVAARNAIPALSRLLEAQAGVPEGWVMVPIQPTEEMLQAAHAAWKDDLATRVETPELIEQFPEFRWRKPFIRTWQAMAFQVKSGVALERLLYSAPHPPSEGELK